MLVFIDINLLALAIANGFYGQYAAAIGCSFAAGLLSIFIAIRGL
jgi:hypothetical protein